MRTIKKKEFDHIFTIRTERALILKAKRYGLNISRTLHEHLKKVIKYLDAQKSAKKTD